MPVCQTRNPMLNGICVTWSIQNGLVKTPYCELNAKKSYINSVMSRQRNIASNVITAQEWFVTGEPIEIKSVDWPDYLLDLSIGFCYLGKPNYC